MSTSYYADRLNVSWLRQQHPDWSQQDDAEALGRSKSWVQKWLMRLHSVPPTEQEEPHRIGPLTRTYPSTRAYRRR